MPSTPAQPIRDPQRDDFPAPADVDDPIGRIGVLPAPPPRTLPDSTLFFGLVAFAGAMALVNAALEAIHPDAPSAAFLVFLSVVVIALARQLDGRHAEPEPALQRLASEVDFQRELHVVRAAVERADLADIRWLCISLDRPRGGTPFDPDDPAHRRMAHRLHSARLRDGLALESDLWLALLDVADIDAARIGEWFAIASWLEERDDPRTAWLAASALAESRRHPRALEALARLVERSPDAGSTGPLCAAIEREGAPAARVAVALHRHDPAVLDRLLAECAATPDLSAEILRAQATIAVHHGDTAAVDRVIEALEATPDELAEIIRTRCAMGPAPLERWAADPRLTLAVCRVDPRAVQSAHLLALIADDDMPTVAEAATRAMERDSPDSLSAARRLLDRPAVLEDALLRQSPLRPAVASAIEHLGRFGAADDLPRIGRWLHVSRADAHAGRWLNVLRARLDELHGGGLALAAPGGGELSPADRTAQGALTPVEERS